MNARIRIMLDSREIEEMPAPDEEVLGMWRKALRTARSSAAPALADDRDSRFTLVYQSALQGATAVVRAAGYRVRGDSNHHLTFAAQAALAPDELAEAARSLNVIRQRRHAAVYDWQSTTLPAHLDSLREATSTLHREAYAWLRQQRASLAAVLDAPSAP